MSNAAQYDFTLTGSTPVIFHSNIVEKADLFEEWLKSDASANTPKGDDRYPAWKWQLYVPTDEDAVAFPNVDVMAAIKNGAKKVTLRGQTTYLRDATTGIHVATEFCRFESPKGPLTVKWMQKVATMTYAEQAQEVKKMGGRLRLDRLPINNGKSKNVRVRAEFPTWTVSGRIMVLHDMVPKDVFSKILENAGRYGGLGDYRPSSKKPGPYGQFTATIKAVK